MSNAFLYRMPGGIPGDITRYSVSTIEPQLYDPSAPFAAYGIPVKVVSGKIRPLVSGDDASVIYGMLVRPYPTQGAQEPLGQSTPHTAGPANVLRRGYIAVKLNAGAASLAAPVYIRISSATDDKPIGGIEAVADGTNTVQLPNATFMTDADADGNVEIAYNL